MPMYNDDIRSKKEKRKEDDECENEDFGADC